MPQFALALALLGIAGFFVSAEILLHPEIFKVAENKTHTERTHDNSPNTLVTSNTNEENTKEKIPLSDELFSVQKLQESNITLSQGRYSHALFQHAPITPSRDSFSLVTFAFQIDGKPIGTVSRILPVNNVSAGRLLSLVRQKLQSIISPEDKDHLSLSQSLNTVGDANFYLNDRKSFPTTIFLVARSNTKVLAFQYLSSYHESVKKNIPLFFQ